MVLLVPFLLVPAALSPKRAPWRARLGFAAVGLLVAALVIAPWVGRNLATFRDPTFLSTGEGPVIAGANCNPSYYGPELGTWNLGCTLPVPKAPDQSVQSTLQYNEGKRYLQHHLGRLPVVLLARVGRLWDLYEPLQMVDFDVNEGRPVPASFAGLLSYYALLPVAAMGVVVLRRRHRTQWPLLVCVPVLTLVAMAGYGLVRFRAEFEVSLVVLAAVGVDAGWSWLAQRRHVPTPSRHPDAAIEPK
jgi:hypothetical protein